MQGEERRGSCLSVAKGLYDCFLSEDGFSSKAFNTHCIGCFLSALTKALNISAGGGRTEPTFPAAFLFELTVGRA